MASGGHSSSRCAGPSLSGPLLLRSTGSRRAGSAAAVHGPSRSAACGILPDQGPNPRPLHWQADSQPLRHQGSPRLFLNAGGTSKAGLRFSSAKRGPELSPNGLKKPCKLMSTLFLILPFSATNFSGTSGACNHLLAEKCQQADK